MRYYCTYFDRHYLLKGLSLLKSLKKHENQSFKTYVICLDEISRVILNRLNLPYVCTIPLHELENNDKDLLKAKTNRTLVEYYWTLTPTVLLRIFEENNQIPELTYLDSDLFFFSSPEPIFKEFKGHSILIHEHRYIPSLQHLIPNGIYNVGLLYFQNDENSMAALKWWRDRCNEWCHLQPEDGKMGDQKYLDDWPQRFKGVKVLSHVGAGLAPWNIAQYIIKTNTEDKACINDKEIVFFHFHGLAFLNSKIIVPVKHCHYPLTQDCLEMCYFPYILDLQDSLLEISKIYPEFAFGTIEKLNLNEGLGFIINNTQLNLDGNLSVGRESFLLSKDWTFVKGKKMLLGTSNITEMQFEDKAYSKSSDLLKPIEVPNLWPEGKKVNNCDELLYALFGRGITSEIKSLFIIGAHLFQEEQLITNLFPNLKHIYLFEAIPQAAELLKERYKNDSRIQTFNCAISDRDGIVDFHVTDNHGESSSLLKLGRHKEVFPTVSEAGTIKVNSFTIDSIISRYKVIPPDMLFLDVQGAEFMILSSLSSNLKQNIRLIYTEVSKIEMYKGAKNLDEVEALLSPEFSFAGFAPLMQNTPMHGNALFVKKDDIILLREGSQNVLNRPEKANVSTQASSLQNAVNIKALNDLLNNSKAENFREIKKIFDIYFDINPVDLTLRKKYSALESAYLGSLLESSYQSNTNYKQKKYAVTVIVSTYKSEEFIVQCLTDIENQTIADNVEIIVIDANSPEREKDITQGFQRSHNNIRYVRTKERINVYTAWNLAIYMAAGACIMPFSTNDRLKPDACQNLSYALADHPDVDLVYGDTLLTSEPHQDFNNYTPSKSSNGKYAWPEFRYENILYSCMIGPHPMWRKSVNEKIGYFDDRYNSIADQDFFIRTAHCGKLLHISIETGMQWITQDSLSGEASSYQEIFEIQIKHQQYYTKHTSREFPPIIKTAMYNLFRRSLLILLEKKKKQDAIAFFKKYSILFPNEENFSQINDSMRPLIAQG